MSVLFHHSLLGLLFEKFCLLLLDGAACSFIKSTKAELQSLALSCIMNQLRACSIFEYDLAPHGCIIEKHKRKKNQKRQSYLGNKTAFTSSFPSNHRHRLQWLQRKWVSVKCVYSDESRLQGYRWRACNYRWRQSSPAGQERKALGFATMQYDPSHIPQGSNTSLSSQPTRHLKQSSYSSSLRQSAVFR